MLIAQFIRISSLSLIYLVEQIPSLQMHQDYGLLQSEEKEEGFLPAMTRLAASAHPSPLLITFTNGAQSNFVKVELNWQDDKIHLLASPSSAT